VWQPPASPSLPSFRPAGDPLTRGPPAGIASLQASRTGGPDAPPGQQAPGFCWQNAEPSPAPPLADVPVPPPVPPPPEGVVPAPALAPPDGVVPALAPAEGVVPVLAPAEGVAPAEEGVVPVLVSVELLLDVVLLLLAAAALMDGPPDGTVNAGAPAVPVAPEPPPPPHAETPSARASETATAVTGVDLRVRDWLMPTRTGAQALRSRAAPCACRRPGSR
jgi:hypothetical protein